jgi:hypothetical protein
VKIQLQHGALWGAEGGSVLVVVCVFVEVVLSVINYQHSLSVYHCWSVSCHGVMGMLFV